MAWHRAGAGVWCGFPLWNINPESGGWVWQLTLCVGVCNSWLVRHVLCRWRHPPLPSSLTPEKERGRSRLGQDVEVKGVFALGHRHGVFWKCNIHIVGVSGEVFLYCNRHLMSYLVSALIKLCNCIGVIGYSSVMVPLGGRWWNIRYLAVFLQAAILCGEHQLCLMAN